MSDIKISQDGAAAARFLIDTTSERGNIKRLDSNGITCEGRFWKRKCECLQHHVFSLERRTNCWTVQVLSGQRWRAELLGLSPAINTACLAQRRTYAQFYSPVAGLRADVQHLKLRSLPMQKGWRKTHKRTRCLPVTSYDFGWQRHTSHSWLAGQKRRKRRLCQLGCKYHPSLRSLFLSSGISIILTASCWGAIQRLWYLRRVRQLQQPLPEICLFSHP